MSIIIKFNCLFCIKVKVLLDSKGYVYEEIILGKYVLLMSLKVILGCEMVL